MDAFLLIEQSKGGRVAHLSTAHFVGVTAAALQRWYLLEFLRHPSNGVKALNTNKKILVANP